MLSSTFTIWRCPVCGASRTRPPYARQMLCLLYSEHKDGAGVRMVERTVTDVTLERARLVREAMGLQPPERKRSR